MPISRLSRYRSAGRCAVVSDAADTGREVDHDVGRLLGEHRIDLLHVAKVVVAARRRKNRGRVTRAEAFDHGSTEKATATGDQHSLRRPKA